MSILLKNGSLKGEKNVDILIENDKISKVAPGNSLKDEPRNLPPKREWIIAENGRFVSWIKRL